MLLGLALDDLGLVTGCLVSDLGGFFGTVDRGLVRFRRCGFSLDRFVTFDRAHTTNRLRFSGRRLRVLVLLLGFAFGGLGLVYGYLISDLSRLLGVPDRGLMNLPRCRFSLDRILTLDGTHTTNRLRFTGRRLRVLVLLLGFAFDIPGLVIGCLVSDLGSFFSSFNLRFGGLGLVYGYSSATSAASSAFSTAAS